MADPLAKVRERLDEVIRRGATVLGTKSTAENGVEYLDAAAYTEWRMSAKTAIKLLDPDGHHKDEFEEIWEGAGPDDDQPLKLQLGVLRALRDDFNDGYVSDIRGIVRAEVFADFMDQARHLF
jgi:hypothetical protein